MSDDIPILFSDDSPAPSAVFLSAASGAQMQQYAMSGWRVHAASGFQAAQPIDLAQVPATTTDDGTIGQPTLLSCEGPFWAPQDLTKLQNLVKVKRWQPRIVKLNYAFYDIDPEQIQTVVGEFASLGYFILGAHWRDDNTMRVRSLNRIDRLDAFQPPEWPRMNLIACAEERMALMIMRIGRLHAGQEQRIAQLRVSEAVRNEHIARLEAALIKNQPSPHFSVGKP
ncbi:MAG: hypothetical protein JNM81_12410 [Rhodospirillaceae bacterium]|nr:hypothetical protein [Rhodospirillaceae bacterium]